MALPDRILSKFVLDEEGGCWIWTARIDDNGYARVKWGGRCSVAHRTVYELLRGPVPAGLNLDHLCRVRGCVNPDHLEPVAQRANVLRGLSPIAYQARRTHCKNGHEYTAENIMPRKNSNKRTCKTCQNTVWGKA